MSGVNRAASRSASAVARLRTPTLQITAAGQSFAQSGIGIAPGQQFMAICEETAIIDAVFTAAAP
jgi:hypothetical protein